MFHVEHFGDLIGSIYNLPTHDRRHNFPYEMPAIEGSVVRFRAGLCCFEGPAFLGVENSYVGVASTSHSAPASQVNHSRRARGEKFDNSCQRNLVVAMQARNGEAERGFEARNPEHGAFELDDLFLRGVRCVIGRDDIDGAIGERHEDGFTIGA